MKISELLREGKFDPDFDDQEEVPADPDKDKVPHLVMQLRKAFDVDGNYPILFRDNTKAKLSMDEIVGFLKTYMSLKPLEREQMQDMAANSKKDFMQSITSFKKTMAPVQKIKGDRYMSHFAGDLDK
jgi:hypothetical protein